jgi:hypothetical protein
VVFANEKYIRPGAGRRKPKFAAEHQQRTGTA